MEAPVELAASVALVESVALAAIACQLCRLAAVEAIGNTTHNIAAALPIVTGRPRTGSEARPAVILLPNARAVPVNSWADRVEI